MPEAAGCGARRQLGRRRSGSPRRSRRTRRISSASVAADPRPGSARASRRTAGGADMNAGVRRADVGGGIELAYERFGDPAGPPLLLVMGLATQMLGWPDEFCAGLAARGLSVVRFDNRDIGLSTHLHDAPPPDLAAATLGDTSSASYTLSDMARDAAGLLDALELESAHVVGASMGGMIAQTLAIEHPERVRTLTSIMSTTGDASGGGAGQQALGVLLAPPGRNRGEAIERTVSNYRVIGSPAYELDGMGHDLPRALWPRITDRIAALIERDEGERLAA